MRKKDIINLMTIFIGVFVIVAILCVGMKKSKPDESLVVDNTDNVIVDGDMKNDEEIEDLEETDQCTELLDEWSQPVDAKIKKQDAFDLLSKRITWFCKNCSKKVVLMIDEVDKSSDNQVFLHFLGMLRNKYIKRVGNNIPTFWSVILAGVYDVKNMKLKLRPDEEKKYNNPWNIAVDFDVDMSFSAEDIAECLQSMRMTVIPVWILARSQS